MVIPRLFSRRSSLSRSVVERGGFIGIWSFSFFQQEVSFVARGGSMQMRSMEALLMPQRKFICSVGMIGVIPG